MSIPGGRGRGWGPGVGAGGGGRGWGPGVGGGGVGGGGGGRPYIGMYVHMVYHIPYATMCCYGCAPRLLWVTHNYIYIAILHAYPILYTV